MQIYRIKSITQGHRLLRYFFVLFLLLCALSGCVRNTEDKETVVFGISGNPDTLDPHATTGTLTFQITRSIYDTLLEPDENGELVPALAESWEVSENRLSFQLRKDVVFHDGTPFTADDVIASIERLQSADFSSPSAFEYDIIRSMESQQPYQISFILRESNASLLGTLASGWSAVLPSHLIESGHDFALHPVGTGPFHFVKWVRDSEILLQKNTQYWQAGTPIVEGVEFRIITDQAVMAQALLAGQIDAADIVVEPELSMIRNAESVKIHTAYSGLVMVLAMNVRRYPLNDIFVRRGINAAVDKQKVMDIAYAGGDVVHTFMDASNVYYPTFTPPYSYNPSYAEEIVQKTAFERPLVISVPQNFAPHVRAGELYHEMLRKAGFPVELQLVDWSTWLGDIYRGRQFDLTVIGHTGKLDPDGRLANYGTEDTYVGWVDLESAQAIEQARGELDVEKRKLLYAAALQRMAHDLPFVFTGSPYRYIGMNNRLHGLRVDTQLETYDLRFIYFQE